MTRNSASPFRRRPNPGCTGKSVIAVNLELPPVGKLLLVEDMAEQKAIRRMGALRKKDKSFRAIAAEIRAQGFKVTHASVRNILRAS